MATISSHTLNGVDGTHAGGIRVTLRRLDSNEILIETEMDAGGRIKEEVAPEKLGSVTRCELIFETGAYWQSRGHAGPRVIDEIVLRFTIDDPQDLYHMPVILSLYGYSTWKSG